MTTCSQVVKNEGVVPSTIIYGWDGAKFKTTSKKILTTLNTMPSIDIANHGIWSGVDPNIIFVENGYKIYSYNVTTDKISIIKDFTSIFPNQYIWQMHRNIDDNRFSFSIRNKDNYTYEGYAVWERDTDS